VPKRCSTKKQACGSISPTFYEQLFYRYFGAKELQRRTFQLGNFWRQNIGKKCAGKMLMKLTLGLQKSDGFCS